MMERRAIPKVMLQKPLIMFEVNIKGPGSTLLVTLNKGNAAAASLVCEGRNVLGYSPNVTRELTLTSLSTTKPALLQIPSSMMAAAASSSKSLFLHKVIIIIMIL